MIQASARLLDLTRTVSRLGRGPMTGIDRVELAYLRHLLGQPAPLFGLVSTTLGFVLLDRVGADGVLARARGQVPLGQADSLGLLTQRHRPQRARAEADARRLAVARCLPQRLAAMLRRAVPMGASYINVGHANLKGQVLLALKSLPDWRIVVMLHDTIPLDHPQYCDAVASRAFAEKLRLVSAYGDLVVHGAHWTRRQTEAHLAQAGRVPPGVVAPLGVDLAVPDAHDLGPVRAPYFVALGTIEPRKNLGLLAAVWTEMLKEKAPVPHLYVIGNRGWAGQDLFDRLNVLAAKGVLTLRHDLGDAAVSALLQGAEALLFPSHAEGFGLPPVEAAALGVPVLAGQLPVVEETLGDYPVYLDTMDAYAWLNAISHQMRHRTERHDADRQTRIPPTWADHFDLVFGRP